MKAGRLSLHNSIQVILTCHALNVGESPQKHEKNMREKDPEEDTAPPTGYQLCHGVTAYTIVAWKEKTKKSCAFPNIVFSDRETIIARSSASPGLQHFSGNDCPIFPPQSAAQPCSARQVHIPTPYSTLNEKPAVCVCVTFYSSPPPPTLQHIL